MLCCCAHHNIHNDVLHQHKVHQTTSSLGTPVTIATHAGSIEYLHQTLSLIIPSGLQATGNSTPWSPSNWKLYPLVFKQLETLPPGLETLPPGLETLPPGLQAAGNSTPWSGNSTPWSSSSWKLYPLVFKQLETLPPGLQAAGNSTPWSGNSTPWSSSSWKLYPLVWKLYPLVFKQLETLPPGLETLYPLVWKLYPLVWKLYPLVLMKHSCSSTNRLKP